MTESAGSHANSSWTFLRTPESAGVFPGGCAPAPALGLPSGCVGGCGALPAGTTTVVVGGLVGGCCCASATACAPGTGSIDAPMTATAIARSVRVPIIGRRPLNLRLARADALVAARLHQSRKRDRHFVQQV